MNCDPDKFFQTIGRPVVTDEVFDAVTDTVFFIKDHQGRYMAVNMPLVHRIGYQSKGQLIGHTAEDVFPAPLGKNFTEQDLEVLRTGEPVHGQLELHLYPKGAEGWCLTWKEPLLDHEGNIAGLSGISRDLSSRMITDGAELSVVSDVLKYIRENLHLPLHMNELAEIAGFSVFQLDRRIRSLYGASTSQYITRCRIDLARYKLARTNEPICAIALDCGYADQSSFTRQFGQSVGLTPNAYRENFGHPS